MKLIISVFLLFILLMSVLKIKVEIKMKKRIVMITADAKELLNEAVIVYGNDDWRERQFSNDFQANVFAISGEWRFVYKKNKLTDYYKVGKLKKKDREIIQFLSKEFDLKLSEADIRELDEGVISRVKNKPWIVILDNTYMVETNNGYPIRAIKINGK